MMLRSMLFATALLAAIVPGAALAGDEAIPMPVLRANVTVTGDLVRIGDVIENAGSAAQIAIYRAPDLGTTGSLPAAQVIAALSAHQVIGVQTKGIKEITVTRAARTLEVQDIQQAVASALEHRGGLGDAANISLSFDRDLQDMRLDPANSGEMQASAVRVDARSGRFDVTFDIANSDSVEPMRLRFTGRAVETVEVAVLARNVERADLLKTSDMTIERRPKAELGGEAATRDRAVGMQMRHSLRAGSALKVADIVRPDLVTRDQGVTLIYQTAGIYLTTRAKALDSGTEGDVVNVLNLQSKRTVTGTVTGRGQVTIQVATPTPVYLSDATDPATSPAKTTAPVAVASATAPPATPNAE